MRDQPIEAGEVELEKLYQANEGELLNALLQVQEEHGDVSTFDMRLKDVIDGHQLCTTARKVCGCEHVPISRVIEGLQQPQAA